MNPLHFLHGDGGRIAALLQAGPAELYFIGASVTAQRHGWAGKLVDELRLTTGHAHTTTLNAMGGVGLLFGIAHHALYARGSRPRVALLEFSTGDLNLGLTPLDLLQPWLEELVAVLAEEGTPVVFIHNWRADFDADDQAGIRRRYNEVATRHGIPVIENHRLAAQAIAADPTQRDLWFRDVCHTHEPGASAYAEHVRACLWAMALSAASPCCAANGPAPSKSQRIACMPVDDAWTSAGSARSTYTYPHTAQKLPVLTLEHGMALRFRASGKLLGVGLISGPRAGWVTLEVAGMPHRRMRAFDRHSHYERYILLPAVVDLDESLVTLRCSDEPLDLSIASQAHPDFALPRQLKVVHFVGTSLQAKPVGASNSLASSNPTPLAS